MQKTTFPYLLLIISLLAFFQSTAQNNPPSQADPKAEKIKWYSFEEAYKINKKKPKKVFVDVYTDWCGWCKKMDAETFANPVIAEYMNKHFYCVKLDAERKDTVVIDGVKFTNSNPASKRSSHQLAIELLKGKMSYPSYVFLNEKGQWMTVIPGYQKAKDFEVLIHYFGDGAYEKQIPYDDYRSTFIGEIK